MDEDSQPEEEEEEEEEEEYDYDDDELEDEECDSGGESGGGDQPQQDNGGDAAGGTATCRRSSSSLSEAPRVSAEGVSVINETQLKELMVQVVADISELMEIPSEAGTALLRHFSWNKEKLFDEFYGNPDLVTQKVGITDAGKGSSTLSDSESLLCRICTEKVTGKEAFSLPCRHFFCRECWGGYLTAKVSDGPTCVYTTCPEQKCQQIVTESIFAEFLAADRLVRYQRFNLSSFVDINKTLRFCPAKDCTYVLKAPISCTKARCRCGSAFCFRCGEEAHEPATCAELVTWKEKCQNESETANWILANTKQCPKCRTRIEKNQGCNHMTCRQCKGEFCWVCMGIWAEHGAATGGYYKCNRYDPGKPSADESDAAKAKAELDRYLHYYQRYHAHDSSQAIAEKQQDATEKRMIELQENSEGSAWIDVQFLKTAMEQLIECRRVLKYTYVFSYYLEEKTPQKDLFEHHQENLEKFTEHLHELSEMPLDRINRTEVINNTRVTDNFCRKLVQTVKDGLLTDDHEGMGDERKA